MKGVMSIFILEDIQIWQSPTAKKLRLMEVSDSMTQKFKTWLTIYTSLAINYTESGIGRTFRNVICRRAYIRCKRDLYGKISAGNRSSATRSTI